MLSNSHYARIWHRGSHTFVRRIQNQKMKNKLYDYYRFDESQLQFRPSTLKGLESDYSWVSVPFLYHLDGITYLIYP